MAKGFTVKAAAPKPKAGIGGPGRVIHKQEWEEDSY